MIKCFSEVYTTYMKGFFQPFILLNKRIENKYIIKGSAISFESCLKWVIIRTIIIFEFQTIF